MRFLLLILLLAPTPIVPPALIVTMRDVAGAPLPGVTVLVTDASGGTVLGRATTGVDGTAVFPSLPAQDARVTVVGLLPTGAPLTLVGKDARGIAIILGAPPARLDLRAEADGRVLPDPATMVSPDIGVPLTAIDEAPLAATPTHTSALTPAAPAVATPASAAPSNDSPGAALTIISVTVAVILAGIAALLLALGLRWRNQ